MWRENQPHCYSRAILFPHSAKRVRDYRQSHHDCTQNIPWLLWNALLTTLCVSEHYKYMFLVARDLYVMFVLYRGKHTTGTQRLAFEVKYEHMVIRSTNIPWAGGLHLGKFPDNRRLMCCALLKRTTAITQAGFRSQTIRSGTVAFKTLRCLIEVAYIFASVKAITVKFLVWENTTRKELQPLELTSKVTTEFDHNGTSRGLHKERYCRIDIISELKCI